MGLYVRGLAHQVFIIINRSKYRNGKENKERLGDNDGGGEKVIT